MKQHVHIGARGAAPLRLARFRLAASRCLLLLTTIAPAFACAAENDARPNILWLSCEDISPHLGCYGDPHAITPRLDAFAKEGIRYSHAFTTAGVCAPCRSGIITGIYQTSLGTHHMRCTATLPDNIHPFTKHLRDAGYYCTNNSKQDYQFKTPKGAWDSSSNKAHWRGRKPGQPFFSVFNFTGCHESGIASEQKYNKVTAKLSASQRQDASKLELPPYYPDTPVVREDWKRNYELITAMDQWAGGLLDQLEADGLAGDTIVFFWSDHGVGLPRAKRWLYDSGTRIPLIVRIPPSFRQLAGAQQPGTTDDALVSSIDFAPTVLRLAGVRVPNEMHGQAFLGPNRPAPRSYVYGGRDRMDERYDIIRMVRNKRFKYIRNYEPLKPYYQYMNTPERGATMQELRRVHQQGKLPAPAELFFASQKPVEELYDCVADPHEVNNLADNPEFADMLEAMRAAHREWVVETKDVGLIPEPIIAREAVTLGSPYAILRSPKTKGLAERLGRVAPAASEGPSAMPLLSKALSDENAAVRYWGATGLGNLGKEAAAHQAKLEALLRDDSSSVRTAAARALCRMGHSEPALPVLAHELHQGEQWERLQAAIVLDEIDSLARPVLKQMKQALAYQDGFNSRGKYRVRVINRALNELQGTDNRVP